MIEPHANTCERKVPYSTWEQAENACIQLIDDIQSGFLPKQKDGYLLVYQCNVCAEFHIGHTSRHTMYRAMVEHGMQAGWSIYSNLRYQ